MTGRSEREAVVTRPRRRGSQELDPAELAALRPYLDLAREIHAEVTRVAAEGVSDAETLAETIRRIPERERDEVVRAVFDALDTETQWAVIERAFGDEEIRAYLADRRDERLAVARRDAQHAALLRTARLEHRLDTAGVPVGALLTLGLFREADVHGAVRRGHRSATCARRLVLRAFEPARFRVVEDVFDPLGSYFVTADYDERMWRADRLPSHAVVRVGSIGVDGSGAMFEPVLYPGGRVDVDVAGRCIEGRLHLGFAMLDERDVFAGE